MTRQKQRLDTLADPWGVKQHNRNTEAKETRHKMFQPNLN